MIAGAMVPGGLVLGAAACLMGFGLLAWLVGGQGAVVVLDGLVQAGLRPLRVRPLLLAFNWLTQMGTGGTGAAVALAGSALMWAGGRGPLVLPFWLCFVGAEATCWSAKFLLGRVRPPFLEGITAGSPSFPSAHATVAVSVYGFLALAVMAGTGDRFWIPVAATLLIGLIMLSRLLLSLHYLSDVLGGMLVGAAWVLLCWRWVQAL